MESCPASTARGWRLEHPEPSIKDIPLLPIADSRWRESSGLLLVSIFLATLSAVINDLHT